jgi:hypothetical protein
MGNKLTKMASELLLIEEDLTFRMEFVNGKKPSVDFFRMYSFTQWWGSTALGFGGIGGQAMTEARTYVFIPEIDDQQAHVYFGSRYAYSVPREYISPNSSFMEDIRHQNMEPVYRKEKYFKKEEE